MGKKQGFGIHLDFFQPVQLIFLDYTLADSDILFFLFMKRDFTNSLTFSVALISVPYDQGEIGNKGRKQFTFLVA